MPNGNDVRSPVVIAQSVVPDMGNPHKANMLSELEKSRESAAQLLERLAQKMGASPALHSTANRVHRAAHYVHTHTVKDALRRTERVVRKRPGYSIAAAVVAGFLAGRVLRSRLSG
ncbi:MAG TPA: hypothetical protein VMA31_13145 [Bryobacteraceae bacterium]|nr:hypothetical protein [Bryobacteraceae bacterium]